MVGARRQTHFAPKEGVDLTNLAESGWAIIFAHDADHAIREAVSSLLEHRRKQATQKSNYYRENTAVPANGHGKTKNNSGNNCPFLAGLSLI
jgi:hypothetical protein